MQTFFQKYKNQLIFAVIFIVVLFVYIVFIKKEDIPDLTTIGAEAVTVADNKELLTQLGSLNMITLNSEVFNSGVFNSLIDNTIVIQNRKPEGRRNPFLPIGSDDGTFVADQSIVNATDNINGLLTPLAQPNATSVSLTTTAQLATTTRTTTGTSTGTSTLPIPANN
jgi:hypothetical protein